jgi:hypothetical protein
MELGGLYRRKGMGRDGEGRKEEEEMTWPPNKIPGSATAGASTRLIQYAESV